MGKYEEALERAKKAVKEGMVSQSFVDDIFGVQESEDERITNCIEELLRKAPLSYFADMGTTYVECFAYLERQKEQPMSAEEVLIRVGLKPYRDGNQWCVLAGGICGFGDTIDEALYQFLMEVLKIKKSKHSAEWNEEDERMLSRCVKSVECSKEFCDTETFKDAKDVEKDWLKSLPERFELQPKQEWSKEDEEIWKEIFGLCNRFGYDDACRKLRTIRPQPHWKPSEEQMEALRAAMEHKVCYCGCNHHALKSLYNDIQKLL